MVVHRRHASEAAPVRDLEQEPPSEPPRGPLGAAARHRDQRAHRAMPAAEHKGPLQPVVFILDHAPRLL
jgi:hypothetical protein